MGLKQITRMGNCFRLSGQGGSLKVSLKISSKEREDAATCIMEK